VLRDRLRSTALHNTLTLDDRPQSISNGPFHWLHVANAEVHRWRANGRFDYFDATHDGYRPLEHRRRVLALHGELLIVADLVTGPGIHTAAVHWHIDPAWVIDAQPARATFTRGAERVGLTVPQAQIEYFTGDDATGLGWFSPAYGCMEQTTTLRVSHSGKPPFWMVSVFDLNRSNPVVGVDWLPVWAESGVIAHATGVRITRAESIDYALFAEPLGHRDAGRTWRVAELETDARMLFWSSAAERPVTQLAVVDGSMVRTAARRGVHLMLPRVAPDLFVDVSGGRREDAQVGRSNPCAPGCSEHAVAIEPHTIIRK
jgi:hypothetical protein